MGERNSRKEVRSTESETEMDEIRLGEGREGRTIMGSTRRENRKKATIMEIPIMKDNDRKNDRGWVCEIVERGGSQE